MSSNDTRKVFLTGASSGIGLEIAKLLAAGGFEVWGSSRDRSRLPKLPGFHPVQLDLVRADSIHDGFRAALQEAGGFDVLINNAGAAAFSPLASTPAEMVRDQFQLLVESPLELIRLALPQMQARGCGTIVNITSMAGQFPIPFMAPYSAAKAALSVLTQGLRMELSNRAIHIVEVRPGDICTAFHENTRKIDSSANEPEERRMKAAWETQLRNMAAAPRPERVARAVLRAINDPSPPPILLVGGFFQAHVAPLAARFLPTRLLEWGLRRYYRL